MPHPNVLVVVVDGLRASALGAYGNTTFPTPALDTFAAESLLMDWCYASTADLRGLYRAMWRSIHPAQPIAIDGRSPLLPTHFANAGYQTAIITDEPSVATFDGVDAFQNAVKVRHSDTDGVTGRRANDVFETELARVFAAASETIMSQSLDGGAGPKAGLPKLVWFHAKGMYGPWDAPLDLQESVRDEGDPPPLESVAPPDFVAATDGDPDAVFRYASAYAAQIITLDACWERLIDVVDSSSGERSWLIMLIGSRGFPLGEHGRFGGIDSRLYAEQLHVPWLIRSPDGRGQLARDSRLVSHLDVLPTLIDGIFGAAEGHSRTLDGLSISPSPVNSTAPSRETLLSVGDQNNYAIRSASWCLRESSAPSTEFAAETTSESSELYVRPDDRWEANDVSKLCPHILESLRAAAGETLQNFKAEADAASSNNP